MQTTIADRIEFYAHALRRPIMVLQNPFGDGLNHYYLIFDWVEYNPSNNVHKNHLRQCKCIDSIINNPTTFDEFTMITKLEDIHMISLEFSNLIKWVKIT